MAHRKLLADTLSGLARGILLFGFSAYFVQGVILKMEFPRVEFVILATCLAVLLQLMAHIIVEDAMGDGLTIVAAVAVGVTAVLVIVGMFQLHKANKLKERSLHQSNAASEHPSATEVGHAN